ncbi:flagellar basal body rod protein FlgC [Litoribrevibacter albus]|uniref:Flagellar basal-body rod protein FlgC n=1 Tax=Litoribrevibacter albus TaxID=1473156 RepID=A0AA37SA77_9GAMM|nr:flagellar basal body rod protein FlgC [Litoribrevibacter albus]GLQ32212.1 flagellar basal-body rod protein FlgC [Litoribrevibacter albus]
MSLGNVFDIAGTGMMAQSLRLNTTASNIANAEAVSSSIDETYRARHVVFSQLHKQEMGYASDNVNVNEDIGNGVSVLGVVESDAPLEARYNPDHPMADDKGYVYYPNVNVVEEMANMISASRSYQTNVDIMNTAKTMMQQVLTLGQ